MTIKLPGYPPGHVHEFEERDLIHRVLMNMRGRRNQPKWVGVSELFGVGSAVAQALCREFHIDPHRDNVRESPAYQQLLAALPGTIRELARKTNRREHSIVTALRRLRGRRRVHICEWRNDTAVFAMGSDPDVPAPPYSEKTGWLLAQMPGTVSQLVERTGLGRNLVVVALDRALEKKLCHVGGWEGKARVFHMGVGENVPHVKQKPKAKRGTRRAEITNKKVLDVMPGTITELAQRAGVSRDTAATAVKRMVRQGLCRADTSLSKIPTYFAGQSEEGAPIQRRVKAAGQPIPVSVGTSMWWQLVKE